MVKKPKFIEAANDAPPKVDPMAEANGILDGAKGKFPVVVVIGLTESNQLDVTTNTPQYPALQWILNRASFELLLHEKQTLAALAKAGDGSQAN